MIEHDEYLMVDSSSIDSTSASKGLNLRRKQIYSTASASHVIKPGLDQSTTTIGRDMRSGIAHTGTIEDMGANKYFSPVHRVDIYASHRFILTDQTAGGSTQTHADYGKLVRVSEHDTTFWQLVVDVKLLALNSIGCWSHKPKCPPYSSFQFSLKYTIKLSFLCIPNIGCIE